jgi:hypothetical protein
MQERNNHRKTAATPDADSAPRKPKARIQEGVVAAVKPIGLSPKTAADIAGVRDTSMFEAISTGRLRAKKWNGRTLILLRDLEKFLDSLPDRPITRGAKETSQPVATEGQPGSLGA